LGATGAWPPKAKKHGASTCDQDLERTKEAAQVSEQFATRQRDKADLTIKKLTRGNPTMSQVAELPEQHGFN
jgi:hypothetical protein